MATQLLAKFEENSSTAQIRSKVRDGQFEDGTVTPTRESNSAKLKFYLLLIGLFVGKLIRYIEV